MRPHLIQEPVTITEAPATGSGAAEIGSYVMPTADIPDFEGLNTVSIGVSVFRAAAVGAAVPELVLEGTDALDLPWSEYWTSGGSDTAASVVTLSRALDRGQRYRLLRFLRWRLDMPMTGATEASVASFQISCTVS